jgi:hypothetical protein
MPPYKSPPLPTEALVNMVEETEWLSKNDKSRVINHLRRANSYIQVTRTDGEKMSYFPLGDGMWRVEFNTD